MPSAQRQISLPTSKAIEIAYKNIRLRLSRSLLVTSGIVLALAFLISISASNAILSGMRNWIIANQSSPRFEQLRARRKTLEETLHARESALRDAVRAAPKVAKDAPPFDDKAAFGSTFEQLKQELPELPTTPEELRGALATSSAAVRPAFEAWLTPTREYHSIKDELTAPGELATLMQSKGVPTTPAEIANSRIQTRWLLGLALLVAFVGILNAMLMSVTERFREIGTMKCLGALDGFIVKLFLIESLFQGVVGTVLGLFAGLSLSLVAATTTYGSYAWKNIPFTDLALASLVTFAVGIALTVSGALYPAIRAAKMQPIDAMRSDV